MRFAARAMSGLLVAGLLAGCQAGAAGGDSIWQAMGKGALAGIQEGLTGQPQENPYATGSSAPAQQPSEQASSPEADVAALSERYGRKHAELIQQGHIDLGMNTEEVMLAWGEPNSKRPKGRTEIWDYGSDKVVFLKGKVSAVTH